VWLLASYRAGENTQIRALAEALDWPYEIKRLVYRPLAWRPHLLCREDLAGLDRAASDPLTSPWPDLIISAAVRNEPAARWIRRRAEHPVKLVFLGRVWAGLENFDLVVTTPQYRLSDHPRVLRNLTTQQAITPERLADAARDWAASFAHLPRPRVAVLVGGTSGPHALDARAATRLAGEAGALAGDGGSLLVTTSARTPAAAAAALARHLDMPHHLHRWAPDAANPYLAMLALAERIVVTGDSIAMVSEAIATGKPVHIFDPGSGREAMGPVAARLPSLSWWRGWNRERGKALAYRLLMRLGPPRLSRDIRLVHRQLVASGRAVWLGQPFPDAPPSPLADRERSVARVRQLPGLLAPPPPPRTWLLLGHKAGDNTQLRALAGALGWVWEERRLRYRPWELPVGRLLGATLLGVDRERSDRLEPPWPDLILTAGRRNEPVARWIRRQAGAATRIVHVGRPWAPLGVFDLIIATPQYQLPQLPWIQMNRLPLQGLDRTRLAAGARDWRERFARLPRPWIGVLVGGASGPYHFDAPEAGRLAAALNRLATETGGSILGTTSARTGAIAASRLGDGLRVPNYFHRWYREPSGENPYAAILALADRLVVTGESMSMLAEAVATGKPVQVFPLGEGRFAMGPLVGQATHPWWRSLRNWRFRALSHRLAMRLAPRRFRRDVRVMLDRLVAEGRVSWLGEPPPPGGNPLSLDELQRSARRVRRLMGLDAAGPPSSTADAIVPESSGEGSS